MYINDNITIAKLVFMKARETQWNLYGMKQLQFSPLCLLFLGMSIQTVYTRENVGGVHCLVNDLRNLDKYSGTSDKGPSEKREVGKAITYAAISSLYFLLHSSKSVWFISINILSAL